MATPQTADFALLFNALPAPHLAICPASGRIVAANAAMARLLGSRAEQLVGQPVAEVFSGHGAAPGVWAQALADARQQSAPAHLALGVLQLTLTPVAEPESGQLRYLLCRAEAHGAPEPTAPASALHLRQQRLLQQLGQLPVQLLIVTGPEHRLVYQSPSAVRFSGPQPLGQPLDKNDPRPAMRALGRMLDRAYGSGQVVVLREQAVAALGAEAGGAAPAYLDITLQPLRAEAGQVEGVLVVAVDVSEQVRARHAAEQAAAEVRRQQQQLEFLATSIPQIVWMANAEGTAGYVNKRWEEFSGQPAATFWSDEGWVQHLHPDERPGIAQHWAKALAEGTAFEAEYRLRNREGQYRWFLTQARVVPNGQQVRWLGTSTEIHERKVRQQRQRRLLRQFDQLPMHLVVMRGPEHVIDYLSAQARPFIADDSVGKPARAAHPSPGPEMLALFDEVYRTGELRRLESVPVLPLGGSEADVKHVNISIHPLLDARGRIEGVLMAALDVTEQLRTQQAVALATAETRRQQEQFRFLAEFIPQLVWATDAHGRQDYANGRWHLYTGQPAADGSHLTWTAFLHPTDAAAAEQRWQDSLRSGMPYKAECRLRSHQGNHRWYLVQALPMRDANGSISRWFGTCTDIDDAKRVQQRMLEKDRQLQQILGQVPAYVATLLGPEQICAFATPNFAELLGGRLRVGLPVAQTVPELQQQGIVPMLNEVFGSGATITQHDYPLSLLSPLTGQPEAHYFDFTLQALLDEHGRTQGVLLFGIEVTQRVLTQQRSEQLAAEVSRRDEQIRAMTEALPLISYIQRADGQLAYVSPQWHAYTGCAPHEAAAWQQYLHPAERRACLASFEQARRQKQPWTGKLRLRRHDGQYRWHLGRTLPMLDEQGQVTQWYGSIIDVHEQLELQERLSRSEERFRFLTHSIPQIIWTADAQGHLDYLSPQWFRLTGQDPLDPTLTGPDSGWTRALHPDDLGPAQQRLAQALADRMPYALEVRLRRRDGQYRWHLARGVPEIGPHGTVVRLYGSSTDIHEQYELHAELRASEEKFRFLADSIPQLVWTLEPDGSIDFLNEGWMEYTGLGLEQARREGWAHLVPPTERAETVQALAENLRLGRHHQHENRLRRASDGQYRWFLHRARPMRDAEGRILKWFGTSTDIDDYKRFQQELEERNADLVRINQDLDNFVYTASHDLKQPIDNMAGIFAELTRMARYDDPDAPELTAMFEHSLDQIYDTISDLSELVQVQKQSQQVPAELVDLELLTQEVLQSIREQVRATGATIETDFAALPAVAFVRPNLQSVFYNLISNAIKYASPERAPHIRVYSAVENGQAMLVVQDNGLGIDLERYGTEIFQMFRRFHDHVEGSGMGLYLVQRIVQIHGGRLEVQSQVGQGTTFRIRLPLVPPRAAT
ncbi:PAS domain-containing protein [Hymenobacter latericus]|uniref:PAS domain-containing protein n=1 Tax=Hymenobacter sp. YIM 151858-1 TaxID=2987688 RepID=UPI002227D203|nr:PAS domain-containing protein [Hymenobacter sp. YIM 151858-1]UYZ57876.1 PAS domain-containing protein [Hymenobacter sp. YIM 151858-1]